MIKGERNPGGMVPMRRTVVFLVLLLLACSAGFSQQNVRDMYVKTVHIDKVYPHSLGYRILYFKSTMEYGEMYIPSSWFSFAGAGKMNVVWGSSRTYPYLTIYYADGKFDHIVLFLNSNLQDLSWGILPAGIDLSKQFNVQEPPKDF
jgi:hypothetical protein